MGVTADKTKPESAMSYALKEIHIVPGTNEVTMVGYSNDAEVKKVHVTSDVQDKVDNIPQADLDGYNAFFRRIFADQLGIESTADTGEVFSKSSSGA